MKKTEKKSKLCRLNITWPLLVLFFTAIPASGLPPSLLTFTQADTVLCYYDEQNHLVIRYGSLHSDASRVYPTRLILEHPLENNADSAYTDGLCTICLNGGQQDCDYVSGSTDRLSLPFKGELHTGLPICIEQAGNGLSVDPEAVDYNGDIIRGIELFLELRKEDGSVVRLYPARDDFFWGHPNTIVIDGNRLVWDLMLDFAAYKFKSTDLLSFFCAMDIPLRGFGVDTIRGTAFIIPENYFNDVPFKYHPTLEDIRLKPGPHRIEFLGRKSDGEWQSEIDALSFTWTVDTEPPVASLINLPPEETCSREATITVGGEEVVAYKYKLDTVKDGICMAGSWSQPADIRVPVCLRFPGDPFQEIVNTLYVKGIDRAGNMPRTPVMYTWTIKAALPKLYGDVNGDRQIDRDDVLMITRYNMGRPVSGFDRETADVSGDKQIDILDIRMIASHIAGLMDRFPAEDLFPFTESVYCPGCESNKMAVALREKPPFFSGDNTASFQVYSPGLNSYDYRLDDGPVYFNHFSDEPVYLSDLAEGMHTLRVWSYNEWLVQEDPLEYSWIVDLTPPEAEIYHLRKEAELYVHQDLEVEIGGDDVIHVSWSLDGSPFASHQPGELLRLEGLSPGFHTLALMAGDRAGNIQDTPTLYHLVVEPEGEGLVIRNLPRHVTASADIKVNITSDSMPEYKYRLDSGAWSSAFPAQEPVRIPKIRFVP